jgi:hypothetical protein
MEPAGTIAALNLGLKLLEKMSEIYRQWTKSLPPGKDKIQAEKSVSQTDEALGIAKAEIAKAFQYPLCKRHFPPGIMLSVGWDRDRQRWKCSVCSDEWPPKGTIQEKAETDFDPFTA